MSDLIDRQAAIDATWKDPSYTDPLNVLTEVRDRIKALPSAQPEPCSDAISREAVSAWLKQYGQDVLHGKYKFSLMYIWKNLMNLPSVHPTYTDAEVQKIQDMEQAEIEKAFDLGREDAMAEIVQCKDCRWQKDQSGSTAWLPCMVLVTPDDFYCGRAERRTDG